MGYFLLGALAYPALELCWRGRTHPSMALAGGLAGCVLGNLHHTTLPRTQAALLGGCAITAIEAAVGLVWNRKHQVWDYRALPGNWRGQVCLPYTLLWTALAYGTLQTLDAVDPPSFVSTLLN